MPQELPGFYFDEEKNRYFPIKGPIPGSSRHASSASASTSSSSMEIRNTVSRQKQPFRRTSIKTSKILMGRELHGNIIASGKGRYNFQEEYQKTQASQPMVWKHQGTERAGDAGLEQMHIDIEMPDGLVRTDILLAGGVNGFLSLYVVGKGGQQFVNGIKSVPDCVWHLNAEKPGECGQIPGHLWRPAGALIHMPSNISCIKMSKKLPRDRVTDGSSRQLVLITTLGSEACGGSVHILNLSEPLDYSPTIATMRRRICNVTPFNYTVWTADCNSDGSQAAIGTNVGAALLNLETGAPSWVFHCKSDVLSLQLDHPGNIILCGLRNGTILTFDSRQKSEAISARLPRHQIRYPSQVNGEPPTKRRKNFSKQWFELKGNVDESRVIFMPSSISCLESLQLYDQYFLASSMDGLIRLYDLRLMQRGPIQSYEGNVNSHTRIQLGVDPSERILMSGGEDCNLRLWSIKSGELLFDNKFMNSVPSIVSWPVMEECQGMQDKWLSNGDHLHEWGHSSGAWLASEEGIFCMRWP